MGGLSTSNKNSQSLSELGQIRKLRLDNFHLRCERTESVDAKVALLLDYDDAPVDHPNETVLYSAYMLFDELGVENCDDTKKCHITDMINDLAEDKRLQLVRNILLGMPPVQRQFFPQAGLCPVVSFVNFKKGFSSAAFLACAQDLLDMLPDFAEKKQLIIDMCSTMLHQFFRYRPYLVTSLIRKYRDVLLNNSSWTDIVMNWLSRTTYSDWDNWRGYSLDCYTSLLLTLSPTKIVEALCHLDQKSETLFSPSFKVLRRNVSISTCEQLLIQVLPDQTQLQVVVKEYWLQKNPSVLFETEYISHAISMIRSIRASKQYPSIVHSIIFCTDYRSRDIWSDFFRKRQIDMVDYNCSPFRYKEVGMLYGFISEFLQEVNDQLSILKIQHRLQRCLWEVSQDTFRAVVWITSCYKNSSHAYHRRDVIKLLVLLYTLLITCLDFSPDYERDCLGQALSLQLDHQRLNSWEANAQPEKKNIQQFYQLWQRYQLIIKVPNSLCRQIVDHILKLLNLFNCHSYRKSTTVQESLYDEFVASWRQTQVAILANIEDTLDKVRKPSKRFWLWAAFFGLDIYKNRLENGLDQPSSYNLLSVETNKLAESKNIKIHSPEYARLVELWQHACQPYLASLKPNSANMSVRVAKFNELMRALCHPEMTTSFPKPLPLSNFSRKSRFEGFYKLAKQIFDLVKRPAVQPEIPPLPYAVATRQAIRLEPTPPYTPRQQSEVDDGLVKAVLIEGPVKLAVSPITANQEKSDPNQPRKELSARDGMEAEWDELLCELDIADPEPLQQEEAVMVQPKPAEPNKPHVSRKPCLSA